MHDAGCDTGRYRGCEGGGSDIGKRRARDMRAAAEKEGGATVGASKGASAPTGCGGAAEGTRGVGWGGRGGDGERRVAILLVG